MKLQPLSSETPVFKGARPPLLHAFRYFFACVFRHAAGIAFLPDFLEILGSKLGPFRSHCSHILQILREKRGAEIEA